MEVDQRRGKQIQGDSEDVLPVNRARSGAFAWVLSKLTKINAADRVTAQSSVPFFPFPPDTDTTCIPGSLGLCFLTFQVMDEAKQVPAQGPVTLALDLALLTPERLL